MRTLYFAAVVTFFLLLLLVSLFLHLLSPVAVMILVNINLQYFMRSAACSGRYVIVKVGNYLFVNVYLPCASSADRLFLCEETLNEIWSRPQQYPEKQIIIAGDFNVDLESSDVVSRYINNFLCNCLLTRCDELFPDAKTPTYYGRPA